MPLPFKTLYPDSGWDEGGFRGRFAAAGVSQSFKLYRNTGFFVQAYFSASAVGSLTLTRSLDGGLTWNPFTLSNGQPISTRKSTGKLMIAVPLDGALYRVECALTSGLIDYEVGLVYAGFPYEYRRLTDGTGRVLYVTDMDVVGDPLYVINLNSSLVSGFTDEQKRRLYDLRFTPLSDADIAGDLTLYTYCVDNAGLPSLLAKLVVPAAAQRARGPNYLLGHSREIRAEYVNVISVFDRSGVPVASAKVAGDPMTTFTPGTQVHSRDVAGNNTGPFLSETNWTGIYGYPTLLEAGSTLAGAP